MRGLGADERGAFVEVLRLRILCPDAQDGLKRVAAATVEVVVLFFVDWARAAEGGLVAVVADVQDLPRVVLEISGEVFVRRLPVAREAEADAGRLVEIEA